MTDVKTPLIERWFPVAAVDDACGTPAGSGQNEKAIFTWFASRPIAQARAAVLTSLLEAPREDEDVDEAARRRVEAAIRSGDHDVLSELAAQISASRSSAPVVLDCFSGRGIIPLEAAKLGLRAVGTDLSPVAVLASRLLADWPLRSWDDEPSVPWELPYEAGDLGLNTDPKLIADLRRFFSEVDRRVRAAVGSLYPANADGSQPWGYLWATTIPCDVCKQSFPLVGSLVLRHPYNLTGDPGQSLKIHGDSATGTWTVEVHDGVPMGAPTMAAAEGKRGKSARCPFCRHVHPLDTVKAKGFSDQYGDAPLVAADLSTVRITDQKSRTRTIERKVFRVLRSDEIAAATNVRLDALPEFGPGLPGAPTETIAPGNASTIDATGYGFKTFASLMNDRQVALFAATVTAIRDCAAEVRRAGASTEYVAALASFASANLVRRLRYSTRGSRLRAVGKPTGAEQNRNKMGDLFANESGVNFGFDWFETGPGEGPGTWASLTETTLKPLATHVRNLPPTAAPGRFRRASATNLPYRDGTVDVIVTDPPYYEMINYADVSDLFYVWLRRCLFDLVPDLFEDPGDELGLQNKADEIIVKQGRSPGDHRTADWYEKQLSAAFEEMRRVLKPGGVLSVVFGHSDPAAWRRLLGALRDAEFVVTSAWPARTESANTGVASIKVTVTIGCSVAPDGRQTATAAQVEREITDLVRKRVGKWDDWGLALSDQLMAAYGPAMQVVGRYRSILRPDGSEPDLDHFLTVGRRAVVDAHAFKVDELPFDTFDAPTRFSIFWLRAFGRTTVNKGEGVFHAQSSQMRIDELRPHIIEEAKAGFTLTLDEPPAIHDRSPIIHVARALGAAWPTGGTEATAGVLVASGREPDDKHLWATVAELVRQLPESDKLATALTACQRNRSAIQALARRSTPAAQDEFAFDAGTGQ